MRVFVSAAMAIRDAFVEGMDGFSYFLTDNPQRYVVGGQAPVKIFRVKGLEPARLYWAVYELLSEHADEETEVVGFWIEDGLLYLDLSDTWPSEESALVIARLMGEKAIYDTYQQTTIYA